MPFWCRFSISLVILVTVCVIFADFGVVLCPERLYKPTPDKVCRFGDFGCRFVVVLVSFRGCCFGVILVMHCGRVGPGCRNNLLDAISQREY